MSLYLAACLAADCSCLFSADVHCTYVNCLQCVTSTLHLLWQVELYADYDPKMLLPFLRSSQHYTLEKVWTSILYQLFHAELMNGHFSFLNCCPVIDHSTFSGIWHLCQKRSFEGASLHTWKNGKLKKGLSHHHKQIRRYRRGI